MISASKQLNNVVNHSQQMNQQKDHEIENQHKKMRNLDKISVRVWHYISLISCRVK